MTTRGKRQVQVSPGVPQPFASRDRLALRQRREPAFGDGAVDQRGVSRLPRLGIDLQPDVGLLGGSPRLGSDQPAGRPAADRGGLAAGWIMLVVGVCSGAVSLAAVFAAALLPSDLGSTAGALAYWISTWLWVPAYAPVPTLLLLVLPDGPLPGARRRRRGKDAKVSLGHSPPRPGIPAPPRPAY